MNRAVRVCVTHMTHASFKHVLRLTRLRSLSAVLMRCIRQAHTHTSGALIGGFKEGGKGPCPPPELGPRSSRRRYLAPIECKKTAGWLTVPSLPMNCTALAALWASGFRPSGLVPDPGPSHQHDGMCWIRPHRGHLL